VQIVSYITFSFPYHPAFHSQSLLLASSINLRSESKLSFDNAHVAIEGIQVWDDYKKV